MTLSRLEKSWRGGVIFLAFDLERPHLATCGWGRNSTDQPRRHRKGGHSVPQIFRDPPYAHTVWPNTTKFFIIICVRVRESCFHTITFQTKQILQMNRTWNIVDDFLKTKTMFAIQPSKFPWRNIHFQTLTYLAITHSFLHLEVWKLHQTSLNVGNYRCSHKAEIKFWPPTISLTRPPRAP